MKKIYFSMTTHPNMNYDRSLRSVIWEEFPKLYRLYLNYLRDNPPLKSHMQLPPQTLLSLKQCAPDVVELAQQIRAEGRLEFMGTFFSESLAQCQDGMSVLDAAELGCGIAAAELDAELEGFFLQEIAYTSQLPAVIDRLGVQWTIIRDWEDSLKPFWAEGLDGTRCVAVPMLEAAQRSAICQNPDLLPDNTLLITHCDMEIPRAIRVMHDLEQRLRDDAGFETEWCFVSEYIDKVGVEGVKRVTPCTNKQEGRTESPSYTRWCGDHLSMAVHKATLDAMEARRTASLAAFGGGDCGAGAAADVPATRPYTTWEVEQPWLYPELVNAYHPSGGNAPSPFRQLAALIAWGCNSDGRGWYPLLERRSERTDSFREAELIADSITHACVAPDEASQESGPGLMLVNPHGVHAAVWHTVRAPRKLSYLDANGHDAVKLIRRDGNRWEHLLRVDAPAYAAAALRAVRSSQPTGIEQAGNSVSNGTLAATFEDGLLRIRQDGHPDMTLGLDPFRVCVKSIDRELRDLNPEGGWRVAIVPGQFPRLIACRQIDYHIHFRAEYTLDGSRAFADWRFWFTYPTLVDTLDDFDADGPKTDFSPGGLCASLATGASGAVWYDVPFGVVQHPNPAESFVAPLTHAFVAGDEGGAAIVTQGGSQSFKADAAAGRIGVCMGKSITSGGRRKLQHWSGETVDDFGCDTDWYKEFFYGELQHRFAVQPFAGDWRQLALPNLCRALAHGPRILETLEAGMGTQQLAQLTPLNVRLVGLEPDTGRIVLCEMCGLKTDYRLEVGGTTHTGTVGPFGIVEVDA